MTDLWSPSVVLQTLNVFHCDEYPWVATEQGAPYSPQLLSPRRGSRCPPSLV